MLYFSHSHVPRASFLRREKGGAAEDSVLFMYICGYVCPSGPPKRKKRKFHHFSHFWAPFGSQNGLQNGPLDAKLGLIWPRGGPRGLREPIWVDFWGVLPPFWGHFGAPYGPKKICFCHLIFFKIVYFRDIKLH